MSAEAGVGAVLLAMEGWTPDEVDAQYEYMYQRYGNSEDAEVRCAIANLRNANRIIRNVQRALAAQADAGAGEVERLKEQLATYRGLYDLPRLEGGVLSIAHDIHPERPDEVLSRTLLRHEMRGHMRQVEVGWRDDPLEALTQSPWQTWTVGQGDLMEALKHPMRPAQAQAGGEGAK